MTDRLATRRAVIGSAIFLAGWISTYLVLGSYLVDRGYIAFVWPAYETAVSICHAEPGGLVVRISIAVFLGLLWAPLPVGVVKKRPELIAIPPCILFGNWFSGLLWGHAHAGG